MGGFRVGGGMSRTVFMMTNVLLSLLHLGEDILDVNAPTSGI